MAILDFSDSYEEKLRVSDKQYVGERVDIYVVRRFPRYSRSLIQNLIAEGKITVNGRVIKQNYRVKLNDEIEIIFPRLIKPHLIPEDIPLNIIYEDDVILAVNKPAGMIVHPAGRYRKGTLINALLSHCKMELEEISEDVYRPGIVHRLDKDTSGVLLCAKTLQAYNFLKEQFERRTVSKEYLALVEGTPRFEKDKIAGALGRSARDFRRVSVKEGGKEAETIYEVLKSFGRFSIVKAIPKTGRTHQIRVHLSSIGCPIVCDVLYGRRRELYLWDITGEEPVQLDLDKKPLLNRQALHAFRLKIKHPLTNKEMTFVAKLPDDLKRVIQLLLKQERKK